MSKVHPARSAVVLAFFAACTGLDPGAFEPKRSPDPEIAGYAFDAGPSSGAGGRGGASGTGRAATGGSSSASRSGTDEGGATGEAGSDGIRDGGESLGGGASGSGSGRGGAGGSGSGGRGGGGASGSASRGGSGSGRGGVSGGGSGSGSASGSGGIAGAGGLAGGGGTNSPVVHALFFSEYVEGSSSYKALEIAAREASTLGGCRLVTFSNGAVTGANIALDGVLARGETYVLCSSSLASLVGDVCQRATNLTFNGDDAVGLECEGALLDVIGQIGVDPGESWGSNETTTLNNTLRRTCAAAAGDPNGTDPFEPALEWTPAGVDAFDGLGVNDCAGATPP